MNIYSIKDENVISLIKYNKHFLPLDFEIEEDAVVIISADTNIYYEHEYHYSFDKKYLVRRCDEIDGISSAEIKIANELLSNYREMADVSITLSEFKDLSKENLEKSLTEILACVRRHNKISEQEEKILFGVFSGHETKKHLFESGICTPKELNSAYKRFVSEMEWCYGYKRPYIEHLAKNFNFGNIEFYWTPETFAKEYKVEGSVLLEIFKKILHSKLLLRGASKKLFFEIFGKYSKDGIETQAEREQMIKYLDELTGNFKKEVFRVYTKIAQKMIDNHQTHIDDINPICKENGYNYHKACHAMEHLGVRPNHHIRRRGNYLKRFLDDPSPSKTQSCDSPQSNPKVFIISGPSCSGKTTIFNEVLKVIPALTRTVSDTTRKPRENEIDGIDYNFISRELFEKNIKENKYIEHTFYDDNYYGTIRKNFEQSDGKMTALIIDVNGAKRIKSIYKNAITIFIMPPSLEELRSRLIARGDNTPEEIERRLEKAKKEMAEAVKFDYIVTNKNLKSAVQEVVDIISKF